MQKLLELVNKIAGCKINTQKSLAFLYTWKNKKELKKIIPLTIASKRVKYLGINLNKEMEDLY